MLVAVEGVSGLRVCCVVMVMSELFGAVCGGGVCVIIGLIYGTTGRGIREYWKRLPHLREV